LPISVNGLVRRLRGGPDLPAVSTLAAPPVVLGMPLLRTLPGRLVLLTGSLLGLLFLVDVGVDLPPLLLLFRRVTTFGFGAGLIWLGGLAISRNRRAFLWRVRRKLLLSYVFLGVVPVVLVLAFVLAGGVLVYVAVASYVFREGYGDAVEDVRVMAETMAVEIGRAPSAAQAVAERRYSTRASTYPQLSLAVVRLTDGSGTGGDSAPLAQSGPWEHGLPPAGVPPWVGSSFTGTLLHADIRTPGAASLLIRSAVRTPDGTRLVIADLPMDDRAVTQLADRTGIRIGQLSARGCGPSVAATSSASTDRTWALFQETVAFLECTVWEDGTRGTVSINLVAPVGGIYDRIALVNATELSSGLAASWQRFKQVLIVLGVLFLIVQGSALVMGAVLAKSITSAVHELFAGTEQIQQGDFAHRIRIDSRDQLGDLAVSFNRMSASIEHLLHVQREKQRLDDELRIAREIQKSLLPVRPPALAGLDIADLCEPAREVGGDYYDFFDLGPRRLGVLIADVAGKGTSAALYMAELKGLMLALSHSSPSPRQLLIDVNRRLSEHLDNRSFITMTYATIDLEQRMLVAARAGHTPLLVVSKGASEVVIPDGMVLGLRLADAAALFEQVLEEHSRPIAPGDVIVLYTDGITEAMDRSGDLFGDGALARVVTSQHTLTAAGIRERVLREVKAFVGDAEPHDDMTMVVLKLTDEAA
jgi:serine phosphatase RsbU (regulator of sigma subunit)